MLFYTIHLILIYHTNIYYVLDINVFSVSILDPCNDFKISRAIESKSSNILTQYVKTTSSSSVDILRYAIDNDVHEILKYMSTNISYFEFMYIIDYTINNITNKETLKIIAEKYRSGIINYMRDKFLYGNNFELLPLINFTIVVDDEKITNNVLEIMIRKNLTESFDHVYNNTSSDLFNMKLDRRFINTETAHHLISNYNYSFADTDLVKFIEKTL